MIRSEWQEIIEFEAAMWPNAAFHFAPSLIWWKALGEFPIEKVRAEIRGWASGQAFWDMNPPTAHELREGLVPAPPYSIRNLDLMARDYEAREASA